MRDGIGMKRSRIPILPSRAEKGAHLLEMAIVLSILGLVTAAGFLHSPGEFERHTVRTEAKKLQRFLEKLSLAALDHECTVLAQFSPHGYGAMLLEREEFSLGSALLDEQ